MSSGNTERIKAELLKAAQAVEEPFPGYRDLLVSTALGCVIDTTEHDDRRININQRFDGYLEEIAKRVIASREEGPQ